MSWIHNVIRLLFVPHCVICHTPLPPTEEGCLCPACLVLWERERDSPCPICRLRHSECPCLPMTEQGEAVLDGAVHLFSYQKDRMTVGRRIVLLMKEAHLKGTFAFMAEELYQSLRVRQAARNVKYHLDLTRAVVTFVPRRPVAVRLGGYDQSKKLAGKLARAADLSFAATLCRRGRGVQKRKDLTARLAGTGAFYSLRRGASDAVAGHTVLLVDDVVTTGATLHACALRLKEAGAARIIAVTPGRTYRASELTE